MISEEQIASLYLYTNISDKRKEKEKNPDHNHKYRNVNKTVVSKIDDWILNVTLFKEGGGE